MPKFIDITGKTFGKLTVLSRTVNSKHGASRWVCLCECGQKTIVISGDLKNGRTKSCGCLTITSNQARSTHKKCDTVEYQAWCDMKSRCLNNNHKSYKHYGGRGITIDKTWLSFATFLKDMGKKPSPNYSLDRIDNNKGYNKDNCRWVTIDIQNRNKTTTRLLTYNGKTLPLIDWVDEPEVQKLKLAYNTLHNRLKKGWLDEEILSTPKYKRLK